MNFSNKDLYENIIQEITFTNMIIKLLLLLLFWLSCLKRLPSTFTIKMNFYFYLLVKQDKTK